MYGVPRLDLDQSTLDEVLYTSFMDQEPFYKMWLEKEDHVDS